MAQYKLLADRYSHRVDDPADKNTDPEYRRYRKGDVLELDDSTAKRLLRHNAIVAVEDAPAEEEESGESAPVEGSNVAEGENPAPVKKTVSAAKKAN